MTKNINVGLISLRKLFQTGMLGRRIENTTIVSVMNITQNAIVRGFSNAMLRSLVYMFLRLGSVSKLSFSTSVACPLKVVMIGKDTIVSTMTI